MPRPLPLLTLAFTSLSACAGGGGGGTTGSNHVWVSDSRADVIHGFSFDQLTSTGTPTPDVGIGTGATSQTYGSAMGPGHALWVALPSQNLVARYTQAQLATSGSPTPATTVAASFPDSVMFDHAGDLWVTRAGGAQTVTRFSRADVSGEGALTPAAALTLGLPTTGGLALTTLLDPAGHLWVVDKGDSSSVAPTFMRAPDSVFTSTGSVTLAPEVSISTSGQTYVQGAAFDAAGALWAATLNDGGPLLVRYAPSALTTSGTKSPEGRFTIAGATSLGKIAFDAGGGLWIADFTARKLFRLAPSQLVGSGALTLTPGVEITAPTAAGPGLTGLTFDPTPDGLPLAY